jgi:hypothetical protein
MVLLESSEMEGKRDSDLRFDKNLFGRKSRQILEEQHLTP